MRGIIFVAGLLAVTSPANASNCAAITVKNSAANRVADAALIRRGAGQSVVASGIVKTISDGQWRLIKATPKDAEAGIYVFRRTAKASWRYIDVWGGVIAPGEEGDVRDWARKLRGGGPSPRVVTCFIAMVKDAI
jgi:hypothetical protein